MANKKEDFALQLEETAQYMEILGENDFKIRAYRKGADAIVSSECELTDIASGKVKVAGVGEGLKAAIKEFLETGEVKQRQELAEKVPQGVLELMKVPGLGPKKAIVIQKELGVNTIGELEYACRENRLTTLKGFGKSIQAKVLEGIEAFKSNEGKSRIDEAMARADVVERELRKHLGKKTDVLRVGALGRRHEIVESLEFFFTDTSEKIAAAINALNWAGGLEERREELFDMELASYSGKLKDGCQVTLWLAEGKANRQVVKWLCADDSVREQIAEAPEKYDDWEPTWLESEWIVVDRTPKANTYRVARDGGVKGIFHCHTTESDGAATLEEMVRGAEKAGYEYIGISDHSQSAFYASGLKPDQIREQRKKIDSLQKKVSIKIFHGVESDILADGALDYDEDILNSFDFIVGSVHSRFKMDEGEMTKRLVKALKNPHLTMWGHPTGRLVLGRKGYAVDWEACLKAAASNGVAIEINANPHRLDVDWRLGPALEKAGVRVCINPDAHAVEGLSDTVYGEYVAEKAMLSRDCILNRMGVDEMEKYLCDRKKKASR